MYPVNLQGERVVLREMTEGDRFAVHTWTGSLSTVSFVPLGPLDPQGTVTYVAQIIDDARRRPRVGYTLVIEDRARREILGTVSIEIDSPVHQRAELGYILRREAWGQGFATEAAALARDFAFDQLGVHRLWAVSDPDNTASLRVLTKIGMRHEGLMRDDLLIRGERRASALYAMLATDRAAGPQYL